MKRIYIMIFLVCMVMGGCQSKVNDAPSNPTPVEQQTAQTAQTVADTAQTIPNPADIQDQIIPQGRADEATRQAIRDTFAQFKHEVLAYHGKNAANMLSDNSIEYYRNVLEAARMRIDYPALYQKTKQRLSISIQTLVELMVSRLTTNYIRTTDARHLYETAFQQGWIGYQSMLTASLDHFERYTYNGHPYVMADFYTENSYKQNKMTRIGFIEQNGEWKIDIVPVFVSVERDINTFVVEQVVSPQTSMQATIESSNADLNDPEKWQWYTYAADGFGIKFPRRPLFGLDNDMRVYTAHHHQYGQFDVRTTAFDPNDDLNPFRHPQLRKQRMVAFLRLLGSELPSCREDQAGEMTVIRCDFKVPAHQSVGKGVWIYARDREYLILNLAREDRYDDNIAAAFVSSFGLLKTPDV